MRKRKKSSPPNEPPSWVVTFGDMMSLLLCFFIAIVSFSTIEVDRYRAALGAFRGALQSPFTVSTNPSGQLTPQLNEKMFEAQEVVETASEVGELIKKLPSSEGIETEVLPEGVKVILSNPVLFDEGSDALKSSAVEFLQGFARIINRHDQAEILIEGHTDDTPIRTERFPSNWQLSAARAISVLELFQLFGTNPRKMVAIGYGEYRPRRVVSSDASPMEKSVNRRVEILLQMRNRQD